MLSDSARIIVDLRHFVDPEQRLLLRDLSVLVGVPFAHKPVGEFLLSQANQMVHCPMACLRGEIDQVGVQGAVEGAYRLAGHDDAVVLGGEVQPHAAGFQHRADAGVGVDIAWILEFVSG